MNLPMNKVNENKNAEDRKNTAVPMEDPASMEKISRQMEEIRSLLNALPGGTYAGSGPERKGADGTREKEKESAAVIENSWLFIDFKVLFKELLVNAPILILTALITGLGFYYLFSADTPLKLRYESTTKVYVLPEEKEETEEGEEKEESLTYYDMAIGAMLSTDYMEFFKGTDTVEKTIENFGMDVTYKKFCKKWLFVSNPEDTRIIEIKIRDKDPYMAKAIAEFLRDTAISAIYSRMDLAEVIVWQDANLPSSYPISPLLLSILLAGLSGVIGCGIIFVIYVLREKIVTPYDVEKRLGLPVLGTVFYDRCLDSRKKKGSRSDLLAGTKLGIETLCANVRCLEGGCRTIAISGTKHGEGRTLIARRLTEQLSGIGYRALYIDADLRKAGTGASSEEKGLAELLTGKVQLGQAVRTEGESGLSFLPSGRCLEDPLKLLCSAAFRDLLKEAGEAYDFVIIDTPPLDSFIDAAVIGRECGGVLLLIGSEAAAKKDVQGTCLKLEQTGCRVPGIVLNKVNRFLL